MDNLKEKKQRLIDRLLDTTITNPIFQEQEAKLDEEILLATIELKEANLEELDVEAVLEFAGKIGLRFERVWDEANLDQKQRLQKLVFPEGVAFADGKFEFGTAPLGLMFNSLDNKNFAKSHMAARHGFEP